MTGTAARDHCGTTAAVQPTTQAPPAMSAEPAPTVDGVAPGEVAAIDEGCGESGFPELTLTLKQVITDGAGRLTLLEDNGSGPDSVARMMVLCMLDTRTSRHGGGRGRRGSRR